MLSMEDYVRRDVYSLAHDGEGVNWDGEWLTAQEFQCAVNILEADFEEPKSVVEEAIVPSLIDQIYGRSVGNHSFRLIMSYVRTKIQAINLRLAGRIQEALLYEQDLEGIYNRLPNYMKW